MRCMSCYVCINRDLIIGTDAFSANGGTGAYHNNLCGEIRPSISGLWLQVPISDKKSFCKHLLRPPS